MTMFSAFVRYLFKSAILSIFIHTYILRNVCVCILASFMRAALYLFNSLGVLVTSSMETIQWPIENLLCHSSVRLNHQSVARCNCGLTACSRNLHLLQYIFGYILLTV